MRMRSSRSLARCSSLAELPSRSAAWFVISGAAVLVSPAALASLADSIQEALAAAALSACALASPRNLSSVSLSSSSSCSLQLASRLTQKRRGGATGLHRNENCVRSLRIEDRPRLRLSSGLNGPCCCGFASLFANVSRPPASARR